MNRLCLFLCVLGLNALADGIITYDRLPMTNDLPWSTAGVIGGIPYFTNGITITDPPYSADNTGVADCYSAVNSAVSAASNYSAIYFPAGTYRMNTALVITRNNLVLRGATNGVSKLDIRGANYGIHFVNGGSGTSNFVASGYVRGSTNLACNSVTGISAGTLCVLQESNNPALVLGNATSVNDHGQVLRITSVSGTNVTLDTPVFYDFVATQIPNIKAISSAVTNCGVEYLTIDGVNGSGSIWNLRYEGCSGCWAYNVTCTNIQNASSGYGIAFTRCAHSEARTCRSGWAITPTRSSTYGFQIEDRATLCKVEDCISETISAGFIVQFGSSGNVFSYNFFANNPPNSCLQTTDFMHGNVPTFNIFEGNIGEQYAIDAVWGANHWNTFFRNWMTGNDWFGTNSISSCLDGFRLYDQNFTNTVVGNIWMLPSGAGQAAYDFASAGTSVNSLFLHDNWDFKTHTLQTSNSISTAIQSSYYLASKPAWFGNLGWPPIGPDVSVCTNNAITNTYLIPAQARYYGYDYTSPPPQFSAGAIRAGRVTKP